ncbi:MAG: hypothetical protein ACK4PR_12080 [Gammaproteobacteria bacterium]
MNKIDLVSNTSLDDIIESIKDTEESALSDQLNYLSSPNSICIAAAMGISPTRFHLLLNNIANNNISLAEEIVSNLNNTPIDALYLQPSNSRNLQSPTEETKFIDELTSLAKQVQHTKSITRIGFNCFNLNKQSVKLKAAVEALCDSAVTQLVFYNTDFSFDSIDNHKNILASLKNGPVKQVFFINASLNMISCEKLKTLFEGFKDTPVTYVSLADNALNNKNEADFKTMFEGFKDTSVERLSLASNDLGVFCEEYGDRRAYLKKMLTGFTNGPVRYLDLSDNQFSKLNDNEFNDVLVSLRGTPIKKIAFSASDFSDRTHSSLFRFTETLSKTAVKQIILEGELNLGLSQFAQYLAWCEIELFIANKEQMQPKQLGNPNGSIIKEHQAKNEMLTRQLEAQVRLIAVDQLRLGNLEQQLAKRDEQINTLQQQLVTLSKQVANLGKAAEVEKKNNSATLFRNNSM